MDRDKQGISKKSEDEKPLRENIFEKTPNLKIIIILIFFSWVLFTFMPDGKQIIGKSSRFMCHFVCSFDSCPNGNGGPHGGPHSSGNSIPVNNTTPLNPKITEGPEKSVKKILL